MQREISWFIDCFDLILLRSWAFQSMGSGRFVSFFTNRLRDAASPPPLLPSEGTLPVPNFLSRRELEEYESNSGGWDYEVRASEQSRATWWDNRI